MRIGIVAYWFNRGQAVVARQIRSTLDGLGHETFVLARPTRKTNIRPDWIDRQGVWAQEGVTAASDYRIPLDEYLSWADEAQLDVVLFDQNYQFPEITQLRERGVKTVGRFVWEHFSDEHVEAANGAFDRIYSLTGAERNRYAGLGIDTFPVRWGCFPELVEIGDKLQAERKEPGWISPYGFPGGNEESVVYLFPGGFMSKRKPLAGTIEAFRAAEGNHLRMVLKAQVDRQAKRVKRLAKGGSRFGFRDHRIELVTADLPFEEYLAMFAAANACLAPSRWEGLGLHLYEATALGVPTITNDNAPMNEVIHDGVNGILIPGIPDGTAPRSGIQAFRPDVPKLTAAIERLADPAERAVLADGVKRRRDELSWKHTVTDLEALLGSVAPREPGNS